MGDKAGVPRGALGFKEPHNRAIPVVDHLSQLDPLKFLSSPGLWIGLAFAAAFIAAAFRLRHSRGAL